MKLARQYGGDDLKLFVNDYNLEYDWDASGNKKLESLIKWINKWEADGVTKIDGIGTQMHISCYADPTEAEKRKALIVNSFKMMAETGKLVRISELDMGYVDACFWLLMDLPAPWRFKANCVSLPAAWTL